MMQRCDLLAPAKINLYLEIIGDRPDGYHELAMVMQTVDLCDRVSLELRGEPGFTVRCDHPEVPQDGTNLAHRAAVLMAEQFPEAYQRFGGTAIAVEKHIPVGAGLAGGSTNAAAVLVGLDLLWQLGLTQAELQVLGAKLGSDVPFCIPGGTAIATGRGEEISPLPDLAQSSGPSSAGPSSAGRSSGPSSAGRSSGPSSALWVLLAKYRSLSVSTVWAYTTYRQQFGADYVRDAVSLAARRERVHAGPMVGAIARGDGKAIGQLLYNDLQKVVLPEHPQVQAVRDCLAKEPGVLGSMMSGSGPTVFGLWGLREEGLRAAEQLKRSIPDPDLEVWVVPLCRGGVRKAER